MSSARRALGLTATPATENSARERRTNHATAVLLFLMLLGYVQPFSVQHLEAGLDPSWMAALSYSLDKGLQIGTDTAFTGGPFSPLFHKGYTENYAILFAVSSVGLCLYLAYGLARLISNLSITQFLGVVALLGFAVPSKDVALILPSVIFLLCTVSEKVALGFSVAGTAILVVTLLTKFSTFPIVVAALTLGDLHGCLRHRRWPIFIPLALILIPILFVVTGQSPANIPAFFITSLDVASGYASAMSISGPWPELLCWLVAAAALISIITPQQLKPIELNRWFDYLIALVFVWLVFKQGFVRHDEHSLHAWSGLLWIAMLQWARIAPELKIQPRGLALGAIAIASVIFMKVPWSGQAAHGSLIEFDTIKAAAIQIPKMLRFAAGPSNWRAAEAKAENEARAHEAAARPLPALKGTVDIIPSAQSTLIANGLDYRPRPGIQEYTTYTSRLIELNRTYFKSDRAPDHLLFAPGSIDGRHPASAEGSSWPLFLSRYEPVELVRDVLVMKRRATALDLPTKPVAVVPASLGEAIKLPVTKRPLFATIDVQPNLFGQLMSLVFKPASVILTIEFDSGIKESYRMIPSQARAGFVLSPLIESAADFTALLSADTAQTLLRQAHTISITTENNWQFNTAIKMQFDVLDLSSVVRASSALPVVEEARNRIGQLSDLVWQNRKAPSLKMRAHDGVFVQAPSELVLATSINDEISIEFGMRPRSYTGKDSSDGICVTVKVRDGDATLFERCINPKEIPADRGVQSAKFAVPRNAQLALITRCRSRCNLDFSFWRSAQLSQR